MAETKPTSDAHQHEPSTIEVGHVDGVVRAEIACEICGCHQVRIPIPHVASLALALMSVAQRLGLSAAVVEVAAFDPSEPASRIEAHTQAADVVAAIQAAQGHTPARES